MIDRNLGNVERSVRLTMGIILALWAFQQNALNAMEWFVMGVAVALILNGVFSRCYFWYVLDLNTCGSDDGECRPESTCP